jgi:hypothetical protein
LINVQAGDEAEKVGNVFAVPPLSVMLTIITLPEATPVGLLMVSDAAPPPLLAVVTPTSAMAASVNVAEALSWEDSPVAVAWKVAPIKSEEKMYQLVRNLPCASATTVHGWKDCWLGFVSTTAVSTVSPGRKPLPVK